MKKLLADKRNVVIFLLGILYLVMIPQESLRFTFWIIFGVFVCSSLDYLIKLLFFNKKIIPKSAIITGIIIAGVIDYNQSLLLLAIISSLAIISKYTLQFRRTRIFNPANFALFFAILFKVPLSWHIEANILLIIIVGLYLVHKLKKIPHIISFLIVFMGLFLLIGVNPVSFLSWFFVFIMLIEPKSSGYGLIRGISFGAIAAGGAFITFQFFPGVDVFIFGLFIANLFNPALNFIRR